MIFVERRLAVNAGLSAAGCLFDFLILSYHALGLQRAPELAHQLPHCAEPCESPPSCAVAAGLEPPISTLCACVCGCEEDDDDDVDDAGVAAHAFFGHAFMSVASAVHLLVDGNALAVSVATLRPSQVILYFKK